MEKRRISQLQYIRAIAAIEVLLAHTVLSTGAFGVDIFFILSGFLMTHLIFVGHYRSSLTFFRKRITRIAPLYYLATFVFILSSSDFNYDFEHYLTSFLFIKNFIYSRPILSVGWTLEYEVPFYLIIALFMNRKKPILSIIIVLLISSFIVDFLLTDKHYGHFIEFVFGIIIYKLRDHVHKMHYWVLLTIGLVLLYYGIDIFYRTMEWRFFYIGIPSAIVFTGLLMINIKNKDLHKLITLIGDSSYSLYLFHVPLLSIWYSVTDSNREAYSTWLALPLVILMSIVIYRFVEKPLMKIFN